MTQSPNVRLVTEAALAEAIDSLGGLGTELVDADFGANGVMVRTASGAYTTRTLTGTANLITVTNGDGVSGNPTITVGANVYQSGGTDVPVADGGTGRSTATTAYGIIAAGTTATGAQQTISPGTSGHFLKSAGAGALAAFAAITAADVSDFDTAADARVTAANKKTDSVSANSKLLGRGDSGAPGAIQEITLGTNLSMSGTTLNATGGGGSGDVVGPASSTDNTIPRFDLATGKLLQGSGVTISDTNVITGHTQSFNTITQATSRLLGRTTASTGATEEISVSADLSLASGVLGLAAGVYKASGTDVAVADGGTGRSTSTTAYGLIAAGTTATGVHQTISPGTTGQFLKSAGASALGAFANIVPGDVTMATDRILGRTTASAGAVEEITVGSGLSLAAGVLSATGGGTGDVTAASNFANDNRVIRSDGTTKGVQASGITVDDSNVMSGHTQSFNTITQATARLLGRTTASTGATEEISVSADLSLSGGTLGVAAGIYKSGGTDVAVADGGTGRSTSTTAYGIIAAGTTATGAHQTISPGTSGQFLKSAGTSALAAMADIVPADINVSATDRLIGRGTTGAGDAEEITLGAGLDLTGTVLTSPSHNLPSYVATNAPREFDSRLSVYNAKSTNMRFARAGMARAQEGGLMHILAFGDSLGIGTDGHPTLASARQSEEASYPRAAGRAIANFLGVREAGGISVPTAANTGTNASSTTDRWTTTGTVAFNAPYATLNANATLTFHSIHPGTTVDIYIDHRSAAGEYSIDGGTPVTITAGNTTSTHRKISITGLSDTVHSVTITCGGTNWMFVHGIAVTATSGVAVHNLCYGGTSAAQWATGGTAANWWTVTGSDTGVYYSRKLMFDAAGITPDLYFINIGGNDIYAGRVTPANALTALQTMEGWWSTATDPVLFQSWEISNDAFPPGTNMTDWNTYTSGKYDLANTLDVMLIDWRHRYGDAADLDALDLVGGDLVHPKWGTNRDMGRSVAQVFTGNGPRKPIVRTSAWLTANATAPGIENDTVFYVTP